MTADAQTPQMNAYEADLMQRLLVAGGTFLFVVMVAQGIADSHYGPHHIPQMIGMTIGVLMILAMGQLAVALIWTLAECHQRAHPRPSRYAPPRSRRDR